MHLNPRLQRAVSVLFLVYLVVLLKFVLFKSLSDVMSISVSLHHISYRIEHLSNFTPFKTIEYYTSGQVNTSVAMQAHSRILPQSRGSSGHSRRPGEDGSESTEAQPLSIKGWRLFSVLSCARGHFRRVTSLRWRVARAAGPSPNSPARWLGPTPRWRSLRRYT